MGEVNYKPFVGYEVQHQIICTHGSLFVFACMVIITAS